MRRYLTAGPLIAIGLIIMVVAPWADFQPHSHWQKVGWIPFVSPPIRLRDVLANMALFAPLGLSMAWNSVSRHVIAHAAVIGAGLSVLLELAQVYSHSRYPSATDVAANILGAVTAAAMVSVIRSR